MKKTFKPEQTLWTNGYNLKGKTVRIQVTFVAYLKGGADFYCRDCKIMSGGLTMPVNSASLSATK